MRCYAADEKICGRFVTGFLRGFESAVIGEDLLHGLHRCSFGGRKPLPMFVDDAGAQVPAGTVVCSVLPGKDGGPEGTYVAGVGQHQMWAAQFVKYEKPRTWLNSGGLGTMGFGLPAAVGAALANPQRKVICFSGDGSLMMNIQEMATAAENQLDVKIILMNNEALGLVHQQQSLFYKQGVFAATYPGMVNFMQIAAGFGLQTCDLNNEADPQAALQAIIDRPGPALIHVRIDAEEKVYPMVPPGAANTEMVGE